MEFRSVMFDGILRPALHQSPDQPHMFKRQPLSLTERPKGTVGWGGVGGGFGVREHVDLAAPEEKGLL